MKMWFVVSTRQEDGTIESKSFFTPYSAEEYADELSRMEEHSEVHVLSLYRTHRNTNPEHPSPFEYVRSGNNGNGQAQIENGKTMPRLGHSR
jgi:hypothetical protein